MKGDASWVYLIILAKLSSLIHVLQVIRKVNSRYHAAFAGNNLMALKRWERAELTVSLQKDMAPVEHAT